MISLVFAAVSAVFLLPWEYHIDCSGWTGARVAYFEMRAIARDGAIVEVGVELQPRADAEDARYPLWRDLNEAGWRVTKVGKAILVVEGSPKSAVRSIEFTSKAWKPEVRMVLKVPEKK
jgi:hypothetical protein